MADTNEGGSRDSEAMSERAFEGRCHCGAIGFTYRTAAPPQEWAVRECQCSFCRGHGARTTAGPHASVRFHIADPAKLVRYRFGTRTTDFLVCGGCGVYLGAVITSEGRRFATLNVNTIREKLDVPAPQAVSYDGETTDERRSRREERWTPVEGGL
jgi:hypothetical protein